MKSIRTWRWRHGILYSALSLTRRCRMLSSLLCFFHSTILYYIFIKPFVFTMAFYLVIINKKPCCLYVYNLSNLMFDFEWENFTNRNCTISFHATCVCVCETCLCVCVFVCSSLYVCIYYFFHDIEPFTLFANWFVCRPIVFDTFFFLLVYLFCSFIAHVYIDDMPNRFQLSSVRCTLSHRNIVQRSIICVSGPFHHRTQHISVGWTKNHSSPLPLPFQSTRQSDESLLTD